MAQAIDLAYTVGEIKSLLEHVPDNTPVEIEPITAAYFGASHKLRVHKDCRVFNDTGREVKVDEPGGHLVIYIHEDR